MSNFWDSTNSVARHTLFICGIGALIVALWIVWLDNSDFGGWVDWLPWIGSIIFAAGIGYLFSKSGRRQ